MTKCNLSMISIIVPVYNVEPYLNRCIASIVGQTYRNLEIILVDDGSTDRSGLICDAYEKIDKRVKVLHKQNGGAASARNWGLEIAEGKYIGFVDGDDYLALDMYESLVGCVETDVDIVACGRCRVDPPNVKSVKRKTLCDKLKTKYNTEQAIEELLKGKLFSYGVVEKLYRKELFEGIRFPQGRVSEDLPVTYALFKKCRNVVNTGEAKYYQFRRENGISRKDFFFRRIDNVLFQRDIFLDIQKEYPQFRDIAEANYIFSVVMRINDIRKSKDRIQYAELEKRLIKVLRKMRMRVVVNRYLNWEQKESIIRMSGAKEYY